MQRNAIPFQTLYAISKRFYKESPSPKPKRGRPPLYQEGLILSLWLFKQMNGLSLRKLEALTRQLVKDVPDFSTIHYRVQRIPEELWHSFLR